MQLLVNIDVPDLAAAERFYVEAFGLAPSRRFGADAVELSGWPAKVYLLAKAAGTPAWSKGGAGDDRRRYDRHWTPVHLDVAVDDLDSALAQAVAAGAVVEVQPKSHAWGTIAMLADPFGHGVCLIQFHGRGYDEIATPV